MQGALAAWFELTVAENWIYLLTENSKSVNCNSEVL